VGVVPLEAPAEVVDLVDEVLRDRVRPEQQRVAGGRVVVRVDAEPVDHPLELTRLDALVGDLVRPRRLRVARAVVGRGIAAEVGEVGADPVGDPWQVGDEAGGGVGGALVRPQRADHRRGVVRPDDRLDVGVVVVEVRAQPLDLVGDRPGVGLGLEQQPVAHRVARHVDAVAAGAPREGLGVARLVGGLRVRPPITARRVVGVAPVAALGPAVVAPTGPVGAPLARGGRFGRWSRGLPAAVRDARPGVGVSGRLDRSIRAVTVGGDRLAGQKRAQVRRREPPPHVEAAELGVP
jgi:hypothetical protein